MMRIKNWSDFQHFKNRTPPWIKLHKSILEQRDINLISDCSFRVLIGLWLLASEDKDMDGNLPEITEIAFRLRIDQAKIINSLHELQPFLHDFDITAISRRYQVDDPEKRREETEEETEKEKENNTCRKSNGKHYAGADEFEQVWQHWPIKRNKSNAKRAFLRKKFKPNDVPELIADIQERMQKDKRWREGFIPHMSTYINGDRWEDDWHD